MRFPLSPMRAATSNIRATNTLRPIRTFTNDAITISSRSSGSGLLKSFQFGFCLVLEFVERSFLMAFTLRSGEMDSLPKNKVLHSAYGTSPGCRFIDVESFSGVPSAYHPYVRTERTTSRNLPSKVMVEVPAIPQAHLCAAARGLSVR